MLVYRRVSTELQTLNCCLHSPAWSHDVGPPDGSTPRMDETIQVHQYPTWFWWCCLWNTPSFSRSRGDYQNTHFVYLFCDCQGFDYIIYVQQNKEQIANYTSSESKSWGSNNDHETLIREVLIHDSCTPKWLSAKPQLERTVCFVRSGCDQICMSFEWCSTTRSTLDYWSIYTFHPDIPCSSDLKETCVVSDSWIKFETTGNFHSFSRDFGF